MSRPWVRVSLTTQDGEVLDQFVVSCYEDELPMGVVPLSHKIRETLEIRYEVPDE